MSADVTVACESRGEGFECRVRVGDDPRATSHVVSLGAATLARLAPAGTLPDDLVRASFDFLLEREPREAILRSFELPVIERYFPGYEAGMRARLASPPGG
ncbi:hypothetical protein BH24CHL9_BH24CHL9_16530 [soil metagenome]